MRVAIVHNAVPGDAAPDEQDVLVQVEAIAAALRSLGHEAGAIACDLDLPGLKSRLAETRPGVIFNLVESLAGQGRLIHVVPGLLDVVGIPYTGSAAEALFLTSHKILAKERLHAAGLSTPSWRTLDARGGLRDGGPPAPAAARFIVKSVWEDASLGLEDDAILPAAEETRLEALLRARAELGVGAWFAEQFIEGRELNLSILEGPAGPEVLPPAEIRFEDFPEGKPRIVGYRAKWDPGSFEYRNTPRSFAFAPGDAPLLAEATRCALACWDLLGLAGYGRVDFRIDAAGRPWILEANANPCLSPDAGFAAAAEQAGLSYRTVVERILRQALAPCARGSTPRHREARA